MSMRTDGEPPVMRCTHIHWDGDHDGWRCWRAFGHDGEHEKPPRGQSKFWTTKAPEARVLLSGVVVSAPLVIVNRRMG